MREHYTVAAANPNAQPDEEHDVDLEGVTRSQ